MTPETIGITITYKEPITFHLRMIGVQEETELRQKLFGLTDKEKAEKQYQLNVDMLADLSEKLPDGMFGEAIPKGLTPDVIRIYFAEKTVIKERIADYAVRAYFLKLEPNISFL